MAEDSLIKVDGLSKKFGKSMKHNMLYGAHDLARSFFGMVKRDFRT
jgi:hypothetical protein